MTKFLHTKPIKPRLFTDNAYSGNELIKEDIIYAIENQLLLKVNYNGGNRVIEPHCFGLANTNNRLLRAYQTSGYAKTRKHGWKLLDLKKIKSCEIQTENFRQRLDYKRNDKDMKLIYSQL
jgi:hypothetical protein